MKIRNKLLIVFCVLSVATSAQSADSALCSSGYSVFFGNGIRTEPIGAQAAARRVRSMLGSEYDGEPMSYSVSYNPSEGVLGDLLEAFAQKREEDPTLTWQLFFRWVSGRFIETSLANILEDYFGFEGANRIEQAAARLAGQTGYTDATVVQHASNYESELLAGKRVLLVSHSQGNLYANAAYSRLLSLGRNDYDLDAFGIAAVASPANNVATGDNYVTSDSDLVIDTVRNIIAPATLPANDFSVPSFPAGDRLGHGFNEIYTSQSYPSIRNHSLNVMRSTLSRLSSVTPNPSAVGPITATLTWNIPGDIDLHSFEPTAHVYYINREGAVGYLDRDDTSGTGPEHYYTSCEDFTEGTYSFGVNYYSGSGAKTATIQLSVLGVNYPARSIVLTTPEYSSGNSSPSILYRVNVVSDGNGGYQATVQ